MIKTVSIKDIVDNDICIGCGVCVSESKGSLKMEWDQNGFLKPKEIGFFQNDLMVKVCPFNPSPDREVENEDKLARLYFNDTNKYDSKIGIYENTYVGYAVEYRDTSSSGGIATYIFEKLLANKIVNHLYIVKEVNGSYEYQLFSDFNQIKEISKTRYIPVTLENFFNEIESLNGRIAVSGVACFVKAIRLKQYYHPELKEKIPFIVGIICGGFKSSFFSDYLAQKSGIKGSYSKQDYRIKDANSFSSDYSFGALDENDEFFQMKMKKVVDMWGTGFFKPNACDFCTDVTTELADISLGDAWLDEYREDGMGNSIIVTRSKLADKLIKAGIENEDLKVVPLSVEKVIESQKGSFTHRHKGLTYRVNLMNFKNRLLPKHRERVYEKLSLSLKFVQFCRRITRERSIVIWRKYKEASIFDVKIKKYLYLLTIATKINHKLRGK